MPSPRNADMTFEDLPTLQDALRSCDRSLLVRVVMADQVQGSFPRETAGKEQRASMERRIEETLEAMCSLDVRRKGKRQLVLYPEESFSLDGRTGMIKRRLAASLFDLRHVPAVKRARKALGKRARSYKQVKRILKDKRRLAVIEAEELEPQAYTLVPWEKVLAYRVWLPDTLCLREHYMVLASAFWEMAFYGFEQDRMRENSACGAAWGQVAAGRAEGGEGSPAEPGERAFAQCGDAAGESGAAAAPAAGAPAGNPEKAPAGLLSMMATDRFDRLYREKLAYIIAVLNHNARIGNCNALLDLACALGVN